MSNEKQAESKVVKCLDLFWQLNASELAEFVDRVNKDSNRQVMMSLNFFPAPPEPVELPLSAYMPRVLKDE